MDSCPKTGHIRNNCKDIKRVVCFMYCDSCEAKRGCYFYKGVTGKLHD